MCSKSQGSADMRNMKQSRQNNQTEKSRKQTLQREENFFF